MNIRRTQLQKIKYVKTAKGVLVPLSNGEYALVDSEDLQQVKKHFWIKHVAGYAYTNLKNPRKIILMHRFILGLGTEKANQKTGIVDHINGERLDNRKLNLRITTQAENVRNKTRLRKDNTSGHQGVYWDKSRQEWMAAITFNGRQLHLGRYPFIEDAMAARKEAEIRLFS